MAEGKRIRVIEWAGDLRSRIEFVAGLLQITSSVEIDIIEIIYKIKDGQPILLTLENRLTLCLKNNIKENTFNIALGRLVKKKILKKVGHTFALHPMFVDIGKDDEFKIIWK